MQTCSSQYSVTMSFVSPASPSSMEIEFCRSTACSHWLYSKALSEPSPGGAENGMKGQAVFRLSAPGAAQVGDLVMQDETHWTLLVTEGLVAGASDGDPYSVTVEGDTGWRVSSAGGFVYVQTEKTECDDACTTGHFEMAPRYP